MPWIGGFGGCPGRNALWGLTKGCFSVRIGIELNMY
jgi:hypothetical protein